MTSRAPGQFAPAWCPTCRRSDPCLALPPASVCSDWGENSRGTIAGTGAAEPCSRPAGRRRHIARHRGSGSSGGPRDLISVAPDLQQIAGRNRKQQPRPGIAMRLPNVLKKRLPLKSGTSRRHRSRCKAKARRPAAMGDVDAPRLPPPRLLVRRRRRKSIGGRSARLRPRPARRKSRPAERHAPPQQIIPTLDVLRQLPKL
jgi:hypothetical protein